MLQQEKEVEMERRSVKSERLIVDLRREKSLWWQWRGKQNNVALCAQLPLSQLIPAGMNCEEK